MQGKSMNDNIFKHIFEPKEQRKVCATHPVSVWKEGFKRCYWGFKLRENCEPLPESDEMDSQISTSTNTHMQLEEKGGDNNMTDFLPKGYQTPEVPSNYMTLEEGQNYFRVLSSAITGYEWWMENGREGRRPVRVRSADEIPEEVRQATDNRQMAKHFWAFSVFNYKTQTIQILALKQKTIMRAIEALLKNPKWSNPKSYDLIIERVKTGSQERDVEYNVIPEPPSPLDEGIVELAKSVPVHLEAMFTGEDPFAEPKEEEQAPTKGSATNGHRAVYRRARAYS